MNDLLEEDASAVRARRDMANDMAEAAWFVTKVKESDEYCKALYAAMCNMGWQRIEVIPILKDEYWSCSWRAAGRIVSELREEGDYMHWYCSGGEGTVAEVIREDLAKLGWQPFDY